jgi:CBS domain-containing protein
MARYRDEQAERYYDREEEERRQREDAWRANEPYERRDRSFGEYERRERGLGRYGERAHYENDEPRYHVNERREADAFRPAPRLDREYTRERFGERERFRSRLRARDVMTRELAIAVRDNTLYQVACMMKDEDTGVIPVVEYVGGDGQQTPGNGRRNGYGKVIGLITDRDIVVRAVAEGKDVGAMRAGDIMSTDVETAKPTDRVVDVLRKMASKQVRRIPIVNDNNSLLGMISLGDIAVESDADSELADALEDISRESSFWGKIFR